MILIFVLNLSVIEFAGFDFQRGVGILTTAYGIKEGGRLGLLAALVGWQFVLHQLASEEMHRKLDKHWDIPRYWILDSSLSVVSVESLYWWVFTVSTDICKTQLFHCLLV